MARLYAATGDGIARLDESREGWTVELCLPASGASVSPSPRMIRTPCTPGFATVVCGKPWMPGEAGSTARCQNRVCSRSR